MRVVVVGGGWAGCAAAYFAAAAGAETTLVERTDLLLGTGLVGGIMRNNGRYTAAEEAIALGAGDFFKVIDSVTRHRYIDFPGHRHAELYDVTRIEPLVRKLLLHAGVKIIFKNLVNGVRVKNNKITFVKTRGNKKIEGNVFIDATGTAGPMNNCFKYGKGCAMCILRCPSFGPRISIVEKAGVAEVAKNEGIPDFEAMSGSCKLDKNSLARWVVEKLEKEGKIIIPLPENLRKYEILEKKACQQYALKEYGENLIILDTGHAKLMTPFFPLESLRTIDGFREARYADPYSGGQGNSVRFMAIAPCDSSLKVKGIENLFCAGEKTGPLVGHTEAIVTGMLAGHNAVRYLKGIEMLVLPQELGVGDIITYMLEQIKSKEGYLYKYTFSGSVYFERMKKLGLYTTDNDLIKKKVENTGLAGVFAKKIL